MSDQTIPLEPTPVDIVLYRMACGDTDPRLKMAAEIDRAIFTGRTRILWDIYCDNAHAGHSFATIRPLVEEAGCVNEHDRILDNINGASDDDASIEALIESANHYGRTQALLRAAEAVPRQLAAGSPFEDVRVRLLEQVEAASHISNTNPRFKLFTDAELENLPEPGWLIDQIIPHNALVAIVGPAKSYKSFLALDMACHIALGLDWHGKATRTGGVVYIYAEGVSGLRQRLTAWKKFARIGEGVLANLRFIPRRVIIDEKLDTTDLLRAIAGQCPEPPCLILVDTLARNMKGDESQTEDMNAFVFGCDTLREETGATVCIVHHTGHTATGRARGSSALPGAVDTQIQCSREDDRITLTCKFQKDAKEFETLDMEAIPVGSSLVLKPIGVNSGELKGNRRIALTSLQDQFGEEGALNKAWHEASGLGQSSFSDALRWLKPRGYVKQERRKYRVSASGSLAIYSNSNFTPNALQSGPVPLLQYAGVYEDPALEEDLEEGLEEHPDVFQERRLAQEVA